MPSSMKAQFAMVEMDYDHNIIFIEDIANHTGGCTITNDAEAVFKHFDDNYSYANPGALPWRIVYKDTDHEWWEMVPAHNAAGAQIDEIIFEKWHGYNWDALKGNV